MCSLSSGDRLVRAPTGGRRCRATRRRARPASPSRPRRRRRVAGRRARARPSGRGFERVVDRRLERRGLAAAPAAVGGDDELGLRVVDPAAQRLGREAAEDHRVRRADPGAGQHRDRQLGDHRHVDRDAIAGLDAELEQRIGGLAHLALEVGVGDRPGVAGLADPVIGDLVAEAALDVAVDAVVGDVELAADEPLRERQVPLERRVEVLDPVDALAGQPRPERLGSASASAYRSAVALAWAVNAGSGGNVRSSARRFSISGGGVGSTVTDTLGLAG